MTQRLTYAAIGQALGGITKQAVHKLVKRGMPVSSIDAARAWHEANVDPFRQAVDAAPVGAAPSPPPPLPEKDDVDTAAPEDSGLRVARTRQATASAELAELELQERRGDLISLRAVVLPVIEDLVLKIGAALENLPPRAAPEVAAISEAWEVERALARHVSELREAVRADYLRAVQGLQGQGGDDEDDDAPQ